MKYRYHPLSYITGALFWGTLLFWNHAHAGVLDEPGAVIKCDRACQFSMILNQLRALETKISWLETVANQTRLDRVMDVRREACFVKCEPMAHYERSADARVGDVDAQDACYKRCNEMPHSPSGAGC